MNIKNFTTVDLINLKKIFKRQKLLKSEIQELEDEFNLITQKMKSIGCIIDGRIEDPKTRNLKIGRKKFNRNPEEGIKYLISKNVLQETAQSIGNFLTDRFLNKKAVGDYLGNISKTFNCDVLVNYIRRFDFTGMEFIDSIRFFLSGFYLPGESQKIDKIISVWSAYYHEQNPGIFKNENETYIMTYAVIMLNTCLHNPTAKKVNGGFGREEDFLKIMKNFDNDTHFDLEFVKKIFKSIKSDPLSSFHKSSGQSIYENDKIVVEKAGWLFKLGGRVKNLKKRWFVLTEYTLCYFIHPDSSSIKGMIPLDNLSIRACGEKSGKYGFEMFSNDKDMVKGCKCNKEGHVKMGNHCSYKMYATSKSENEIWMKEIERCLNCLIQMKMIRDIE